MAGYSGKIEKCEICGKEIAIEHRAFHLWGVHAAPLRLEKQLNQEE